MCSPLKVRLTLLRKYGLRKASFPPDKCAWLLDKSLFTQLPKQEPCHTELMTPHKCSHVPYLVYTKDPFLHVTLWILSANSGGFKKKKKSIKDIQNHPSNRVVVQTAAETLCSARKQLLVGTLTSLEKLDHKMCIVLKSSYFCCSHATSHGTHCSLGNICLWVFTVASILKHNNDSDSR